MSRYALYTTINDASGALTAALNAAAAEEMALTPLCRSAERMRLRLVAGRGIAVIDETKLCSKTI